MRSLLGTGPAAGRTRRSRPATDPLSGAPLLLVPALVPDVAMLHAQRADEDGHAHLWGTLGVTRPAALAARRVIIVAEEILPERPLLGDPVWCWRRRSRWPRSSTSPSGRLSLPVQGRYRRASRLLPPLPRRVRRWTASGDWLDRWVLRVEDWQGFLGGVGAASALDALRVNARGPREPLDYGA